MNLTTKGDLVLAALRKLGVASNATLTDVEPQSMEDGVNDLLLMLMSLRILAMSTAYQITLSMPSFSTLPAALLQIMRWKRQQNL